MYIIIIIVYMYLCVIVDLLSAPGTKDPSIARSGFDDKVRQLL